MIYAELPVAEMFILPLTFSHLPSDFKLPRGAADVFDLSA
jgi:hypothetical protein